MALTLKTVVQSWWHGMEKQFTDADYELLLDYISYDTSNMSYEFQVTARDQANGARVLVAFFPDRAEIRERDPSLGWFVRATNPAVDTDQDEWYHVKIECDGASLKVWRWQDGEMPAEVFDYTTPYTTSWRMMMGSAPYSNFAVDNVRILADDLSTTSTFTVNAADELVSMTVDTGGTTHFEYDAWGRMTRKYMGTSQSPTFEATYEYKYDDKLTAVISNFPDEGDVSYTYGADGQRRSRTADGVTIAYNWAPGIVLNEEQDGSLVRSFIGSLAEAPGPNPSIAQYHYYAQNQVGSVNCVFDDSQSPVASRDYSPFGDVVRREGAVIPLRGYGGLIADDRIGLCYAPYRYYSPILARWLTRKPSGVNGPNAYSYGVGNPVVYFDRTGLYVETVWDIANLMYDLACGNWGYVVLDGIAIALPLVPAGFQRFVQVGKISKALRKAEKGMGGLPKGKPIVSPNGGIVLRSGKKEVRLDNGHLDHVGVGASPHLNWENWTGGKRNRGGRRGDPIPVGKICLCVRW